MARKDVEQFNLRLNLNNPNHLKIYRTFQVLNIKLFDASILTLFDAKNEYILQNFQWK